MRPLKGFLPWLSLAALLAAAVILTLHQGGGGAGSREGDELFMASQGEEGGGQRLSRGRFQSQFERYQRAQSRVQTEGEQLADSQNAINNAMGEYYSEQQQQQQQQQLALPQPPEELPGTAGTLMSPAHPGLSAVDASPVFPKKFEVELSKSRKRLSKLRRLLHRTDKDEVGIQSRTDKLKLFMQKELQKVRDDVTETNKRLTDDINAGYHEVSGPRGPPGLRGMNGRNGLGGVSGPPGQYGPNGPPGRAGPRGPSGKVGRQGPRGPVSNRGLAGKPGPEGKIGGEGPSGRQGALQAWGASSYWCPAGGNAWTRLVDCNTKACRLETKYNGQWGTVCDMGFTRDTATVVCRGLGFMQGGTAKRVGGGKGHIWLANVHCKGDEGDIGDCPKTCGNGKCNHDMDVGICCFGESYGNQGTREMDPTKFTKVSQLRAECQTVKECRSTEEKKIKFFRHCHHSVSGAAPTNGWHTSLGVGSYPSFDGRSCDDDEGMCSVKDCSILPAQLRSMEIPSGLAVTIYQAEAFAGKSITYTGPTNAECLNWEGWGDKARSMVIKKSAPQSQSKWGMRVFRSQSSLTTMPNLDALTLVGSGTAPLLNFRDARYFARYVPGAPATNFAAQFYGVIKVQKSGAYTVCVTSDDGSRVWIDDQVVIRRKAWGSTCRKRELREGEHRVMADMFQGGGPTNFKLKWSGPDTGGNMVFMRSERLGKNPALPQPSIYKVVTYKSDKALYTIPEIMGLKKAGKETTVQTINFRRNGDSDFRSAVEGTPDKDYVWVIWGSVSIEKPGKYLFCLTSNDGSRLFIDDWITVNNDGRHGDYTRCGHKYMRKGQHQVLVEGFSHSGGGMCALRYKGRDTGGGLLYMKARGGNAVKPASVGSSSWLMRMYKSRRRLDRMPNLRFLKLVGSTKTQLIDLHSQSDFKKTITETPSSNYAWAFYGEVTVKRAGVYTFCVTSDDGSFVYVDKSMLVNNDGLHGPRKKCRGVTLGVGSHKIMTDGFQRYGGAYMRLAWNGPDTGGVERLVPSPNSWKPDKEPSSKWLMRVFKADYGLHRMPDFAFLKLAGEATVADINFRGLSQMRSAVPGTPSVNYAWGFYGEVPIEQQGVYTFCITSDDGSFMYLGSKMIINNDGLHGDVRRCSSQVMSKGKAQVAVTGFQHGGGITMIATYRGPDTLQVDSPIPSAGTGKAPTWYESKWNLRAYKIMHHGRVQNYVKSGHLVGTAQVPYIDFHGRGSLAKYIPGLPGSWYGWVFEGKVKIKKGGNYGFCSTSDDGSLVWVNKHRVVDNDGYHGDREVCGTVHLDAGEAHVMVIGFQAGGGITQVLKYYGPDTDGRKMWAPSMDNSVSGWSPKI